MASSSSTNHYDSSSKQDNARVNAFLFISLLGDLGNDTLIGQAKHDRLRSGESDDNLKGKTGNDHLHSSDHNDYFNGEKGNDILIGDSGADRFRPSKGDDTIKDFSISDGDQLLIRNSINLTFKQVGRNLILTNFDKGINTILKSITHVSFWTISPGFSIRPQPQLHTLLPSCTKNQGQLSDTTLKPFAIKHS